MTIDYEQIILNNSRQLPPPQQQEVLNFTEFLRQKLVKVLQEPRLSLKQLAKLPIEQRIGILSLQSMQPPMISLQIQK